MENKMLRDLYDTLLDTGDLQELMPEATGIWDKDKNKFKAIQEDLDKSLDLLNNSFDVIDVDESASMDDEFYW